MSSPNLSILFLCLFFGVSFSILTVGFHDNSPSKEFAYSLANYGQIPYGSNISGILEIATPLNACSPLVSQSSSHMFEKQRKQPIVLLAIRGNCTFMAKTAVAQSMGASLLLVMDNIIEMTENITPMSSDDSLYVDNYTIPTVFISKNDGEFLMEKQMNSSLPLEINMSFQLEKSHSVNYTFWLTSSQPQSFHLVSSFEEFFYKLDGRGTKNANVSFEAHYTGLFHCKFCNFTDYTYFPDNCISGGRYCSAYPEGMNSSFGIYYVLEDLREICVYRANKLAWWKYLSKFSKKCLKEKMPNEYEACSLEILQKIEKKMKLNHLIKDVMQCFNSSFVLSDNESSFNYLRDDNRILKEERTFSIEKAIAFWPSVTINDEVYKGNLNGDLVFSAICQAFENKPQVCVFEKTPFDEDLVNTNIIVIVLMMIIFIIAVLSIIYCTKYKKLRESRVKALEISEIIGKYQVLHENKLCKV